MVGKLAAREVDDRADELKALERQLHREWRCGDMRVDGPAARVAQALPD